MPPNARLNLRTFSCSAHVSTRVAFALVIAATSNLAFSISRPAESGPACRHFCGAAHSRDVDESTCLACATITMELTLL